MDMPATENNPGPDAHPATGDPVIRWPELPASPALDAYYETSQAVLRDARQQGTPTTTRKPFPGAFSDVTYAEPLAGIRFALTRRNAASRAVDDYIRRAREDGASWREIGTAMNLQRSADDSGRPLAELAFDEAAGVPDPDHPWRFDPPSVHWTCSSCGATVTDTGPYNGHPADDEHGHKDGCQRLAADVAAWQAQWDDEDDQELSGGLDADGRR